MAEESPREKSENLIDLITRYGHKLFAPDPLNFPTPAFPLDLLDKERTVDSSAVYDALVNYARSAKRGKTGFDPNASSIGPVKIDKGDPTLLGALGIVRDVSKNPRMSELASDISGGFSEDLPIGYFPSNEGWTVSGSTRYNANDEPTSVSFYGGPKGDVKNEGANERTVLHEALHALKGMDQQPSPMTKDLYDKIYNIQKNISLDTRHSDKDRQIWFTAPIQNQEESFVRSLTEPTFQNLLNRANDVSIPAAQKYPLESASKEYLSSILRDLQIQKYADKSIKKLEKQKFAEGGEANADQLPPEQDESLIDMATRYGQGVMRNHPVITRGLASIVTEPLDLVQWLATHGIDPEVAAKMTPEELKAHNDMASSIPNAGELANKYLTQAGVRESETLPEKIGELGVGLVGPALLAKAPGLLAKTPKAAKEAFSWGKRILGMMDLPKATALTKASGGPVHMGKGGLLKAGAEELVELAAKYLPKAEKVAAQGDLQRETNLARHMEGSKAPPVLYHGTSKDADFKKFNVPKNGTWFTTNPKDASDYAMTNDSQGFKLDNGFKYTPTNTSSRVIPVHLNAKNPKFYDPKEHNDLLTSMGGENYKRGQRILYDKLRQAGHDSVRIGDDTWVALGSPNQIKSAIGNRGTFDPTEPNMTKSHGGPIRKASGGLSRRHAC